MKRIFGILAVLSFCAALHASEIITATIAVTNAPLGNTNTLQINSSTRTFTNNVSSNPGVLILETNSIPWTATNILEHLTDFPVSTAHKLKQTQSTNVVIRGRVGEALTVTLSIGWGFVTYGTQQVTTPVITVNVPLSTEAPTNQTNIASLLVTGLEKSTNALGTNSTVLSNHLSKGASPQQYVSSPVQFNGVLRAAESIAATNGFTKAVTNINSVSSNHVNYGNAIRSEGTGGNSLQVGSNAVASGSQSVAVGNGATASAGNTMAIGTGSQASGDSSSAIGRIATASASGTLALGDAATATGAFDMAVGNGTEATGGSSLAIGPSAATGATNSIAIGPLAGTTAGDSIALGRAASVGHSNSVAIGHSATSTTTNQIRLGTETETISIPGVLQVSGTQTNTIFSGTNVFTLAVSHSVTNITTLANGVNLVDPGLKSYIVVSGPSGAYSLDKLTRGYDGRWIEIEKQDSFTLTIADESGSGGGSATDRIRTGTGGNVTLTNNPGSFGLRYNASLGRWVLKWKTN